MVYLGTVIRDEMCTNLGESQSDLGVLADAAVEADILPVIVANVAVELLLLMKGKSTFLQLTEVRSVGGTSGTARF